MPIIQAFFIQNPGVPKASDEVTESEVQKPEIEAPNDLGDMKNLQRIAIH
jgi:hypothetical protein